MHLTNVLGGCICQYIRLVYWRDVSLNTVNLLFYGILSVFWISISVLLCFPHGGKSHQYSTSTASYPRSHHFNLNLFPIRSFERDNMEHLCGEILNQSSDASECNHPRFTRDDIDIMLRERDLLSSV